MKNPVRALRKKIKEHFFFKDKRHVFDVDVDSVYNDSEFKDRKRTTYFEYGEAIKEVFNPSSIIDMGCANGYLLEYFHKNGIWKFAGLEGAEAAFKYMPMEIKEKVYKADLSKDVNVLPSKKFYLVNCTEVGEHIPCKYEEVFLKNMVKFTDRYLVLSWADTWEGWLGFDKQQHVNPRSKRYVKNKLKDAELYYNKMLTDSLVKSLKKRKNVFGHWVRNIMVFEKMGFR